MSKPTEVCGECGGLNIRQQITTMVDPNNPPEKLDWNDMVFEDYYWCNDCENDCGAEYLEDYSERCATCNEPLTGCMCEVEYPSGESNCQYHGKG